MVAWFVSVYSGCNDVYEDCVSRRDNAKICERNDYLTNNTMNFCKKTCFQCKEQIAEQFAMIEAAGKWAIFAVKVWNFLKLMQFFGENGQNYMLAHPVLCIPSSGSSGRVGVFGKKHEI